ncbi:MAG: HD domain-containing protein, partial [Polyangiaceae bacterium]
DLDDGVLWNAMHMWEKSKDAPLADLSARIRARSLFKTLELFGEQAGAEGRERALGVAREVARQRGFDPDAYVGLDVASAEPLGGDAAPLMVVYAKGPARPLHEVSFLLGRLAGQVLSRVRLILAPELRDPVTRALGL